MFGRIHPSNRFLAGLLSLFLSAMFLLASMSSPPTVPIGQIHYFDDGAVVILVGIVVDIALRDSGAENIILADPANGDTMRVYCNPGLHEQPSRFLSIGDEARVEGEVSTSGPTPALFATSDGITISMKAESALSVETLCRNWALFEGDRFRICGLLIHGDTANSVRLTDPDALHSIALSSDDSELARLVGKRVTMTALLRLDPTTMSLFLEASSLRPYASQ